MADDKGDSPDDGAETPRKGLWGDGKALRNTIIVAIIAATLLLLAALALLARTYVGDIKLPTMFGDATSSEAPPPPDKCPGPARLRAGYIDNSDYPVSARRAGEEGRVVLRFTIAETGVVSRCSVLKSSGSMALDTASCALVEQRFRYLPACDAVGRPIPQYVTQGIEWRLKD